MSCSIDFLIYVHYFVAYVGGWPLFDLFSAGEVSAFFEAVLVAASIVVVLVSRTSLRSEWFISCGALLVAAAAGLGALKFLGYEVVAVHSFASAWASYSAYLLIGWGTWLAFDVNADSNRKVIAETAKQHKLTIGLMLSFGLLLAVFIGKHELLILVVNVAGLSLLGRVALRCFQIKQYVNALVWFAVVTLIIAAGVVSPMLKAIFTPADTVHVLLALAMVMMAVGVKNVKMKPDVGGANVSQA